jgi:hypothetical protein
MTTIEITDKFYNNHDLLNCSKKFNNLEEFVRVWSVIAKIAFQQGEPMANTIRIKRKIEVPDYVNIKPLVEKGLVQTANSVSKLSAEFFENWWKSYPFRISNGKKIKIGKPKAKKLFDNLITNEEEYKLLLQATQNYSNVCNKLPKDPERFIRGDFWKEYLYVEKARPYIQEDVGEVDGNLLNEMLRR